MRSRLLLTATGAAATVLLAAGCGGGDTPDGGTQNGGTQNGGTGDGPQEQITMAEVEEHDSTDSCWTAIDGAVYDVTEWVDQHPGGPARIEQLCGTDGTENFTGQHSGAPRPQSQLAEFQIGQLAG